MERHHVSQLLAASKTPSDHKSIGSSESCSEDYFTASSVTPVLSETHENRSDRRVQTDLVSNWLSTTIGLDGPLSVRRSSADSSRWSVAVTSSSGSSIKFSTDASKPSFNQRATINWAKSLPKRKPRRQHNITEVSMSSHSSHRCFEHFTIASQENHSNDGGLAHDSRFPSLAQRYAYDDRHEIATKSCPELFNCSYKSNRAVSPMSKVVGTHSPSKVSVTSNFKYDHNPSSRGHHKSHFKVRDFRMLRFLRRFYSGISPYTRRTEFPAPPDGEERRFLSRESVDICPSSGDETPICNTPDPDDPSYLQNFPTGSHLDPLAMASLIIAAGGLDQLALRARRRGNRSEVPTTKSGRKRRRASHLSEVMFPRLV